MTGVSLLIAASSLGILIFFVMTDRNPSTDSDRESCIPCDNLPVTRDNGNMNKLTRKRDPGSGKELCCFDTMNSTQIAALVFVLVDQRQGSVPELKFGSSETPTDSKFVFSPVSAHKQLQPPNGKSNPSSNIFSNMLFNTETDPVKEHLRGVELTKYHLIIKYSGWYFVYSSITFDVDLQKGANCNSFKYKTWKYYIKCQSTGKSGAKTLSSGVTQCCKECSYHSSTSYTGGIFNLKEDDKLSVEVSGSDLVSDQKSSSFLGLAMIGSRGIKQPDSDTEDKKVSKPEKDPE